MCQWHTKAKEKAVMDFNKDRSYGVDEYRQRSKDMQV